MGKARPARAQHRMRFCHLRPRRDRAQHGMHGYPRRGSARDRSRAAAGAGRRQACGGGYPDLAGRVLPAGHFSAGPRLTTVSRRIKKNLNMSDKVAIVTGASRGIGKQIAIRLARNGISLVLGARTMEAGKSRWPGSLEETAAEARTLGVQA